MKKLILAFAFIPLFSTAQVGYSVTVTKLMATADACDGGGPCLLAPQDPVFNVWVTDNEANEETKCWTFSNDPNMAFGLWNDIADYELSNKTYVNTTSISFDMSAFESDAITISCNSASGDDNILARAFVKSINFSAIPMNVVYTDTLVIGGMYNMVVDVIWNDYASLNEISNDLAVAISPNPSKGVFKVHLTDAKESAFEIKVIDVSGTEVLTDFVDGKQTTIDLTNQKAGIYFVTIISNTRSITKRIQVQH